MLEQVDVDKKMSKDEYEKKDGVSFYQTRGTAAKMQGAEDPGYGNV